MCVVATDNEGEHMSIDAAADTMTLHVTPGHYSSEEEGASG